MSLYDNLDNAKPLMFCSNAEQILLRHDVDHSIDAALLLSHYEKEKKISSTYFILHTAKYFNNEKTLEKIKKIEDNGHEIGLHINFLEEWFLKNYDIKKNLEEVLCLFEKNKIKIRGVSAHGSKYCYTEKFINSWIFEECKYTDEIRNGEDILEDNREYQIYLPNEHILKNRFNNTFKMWSIKLSDYNLYYAHNLKYKDYITDSGNTFERSTKIENFNSVQINLHPEHVLNNIKIHGNNFDIDDLNFFIQNKFRNILTINNFKTDRFLDNFYSKKKKIIIKLKLEKATKLKINLFEIKENYDRNLISTDTFFGDNLSIFNSMNSDTFAYLLDFKIDKQTYVKSLEVFEI